MVIQRITLFKIPDKANIQPMLDAYKMLAETNEKDGKSYILEVKARESASGAKGRDYTFVAMTRFKDMEDLKYYDEECEAHKRLKEIAADKVQQPPQPPITVWFED